MKYVKNAKYQLNNQKAEYKELWFKNSYFRFTDINHSSVTYVYELWLNHILVGVIDRTDLPKYIDEELDKLANLQLVQLIR